ncbi:hypothetical protein ACEPAI_8523 [Sanghuangporus weigelae]
MPPVREASNTAARSSRRIQPTALTAQPSSDMTLRGSSPPDAESNDQPTRRPRLVKKSFLTRRGRGRAKKSNTTRTAEEDIETLAGFIKRGIDLFAYVPQAMYVGNATATLKAYENMSTSSPDYDQDEKEEAKATVQNAGDDIDILLGTYNGIMDLLRDHKDYISNLSEQDEDRLWIRVNEKAEQRRAADTRKLKEGAHRIVLEDGMPFPPIDDDPQKKGNGVNHPQLLRMITPMSVLYKHGNDPSFDDDVRAGTYMIDHNSLPAFMFNTKTYNPYMSKKSFLRGYLPIRFMKFIFLGPGTAKNEKGRKGRGMRPGNAAIVGQTEVTAQMIACVCVQVRFYISRMHTWGEVDEEFDLKLFYYKVMSFFRKKDAKWVKETLAFWNEEVFGPPKNRTEESAEVDKDDETSYDNMLASIEDEDDEIELDLTDLDNNSNSNGNGNGNGRPATQLPMESQTQPDSQDERDAFRSQA